MADRWECHPRRITCQHGHPFTVPKKDGRLGWRVDGHVTLSCPRCNPTTYAWGIVTTRPSPLVTLYAVSKAQLDALGQLPDDLTSLEILTFLGIVKEEAA